MSGRGQARNEALPAPGAVQRLASWRQHHAWSARTSLYRLATRPLGSLFTMLVMGLALVLPLMFYLLLINAQHVADGLGRQQAVHVFLRVGQTRTQAELLAAKLRERAEVQAVTVKTPQQGLQTLSTLPGFSGAIASLDHNPLPFLLEVMPRQALSAAQIHHLAVALGALSAVDQVQEEGAWRQRVDALLGLGRRMMMVVASLLAGVALLVVGNTIRVDIGTRREEISVLALLGASPAFIRRPYLYAGFWYGGLSGMLAVGLVLLMELLLKRSASALLQAYAGQLQLAGLPGWLLLAVPLATGVLGWLGARLASGWHLRQVS